VRLGTRGADLRSRTVAVVAVALAAAAAIGPAAVPAHAETRRVGDLLASFGGGLSPAALPRNRAAPVAVTVSGSLRPVPGTRRGLPQLRRITVGINRNGHLDDRGLPVCRLRQVRAASEGVSLASCGPSLVGRGSVDVDVRIPSQRPFEAHARMLAFNGPRRHGKRLILGHVFGVDPPGSFTLVFTVSHRAGTYGTVLTTTLPRPTRGWAYLTRFQMTLHRTFTYRGRRHSYVSAACSAPAGFRLGLFPFARVTYAFRDARSASLSVGGECHVKGTG
jgi:hypothetical protein